MKVISEKEIRVAITSGAAAFFYPGFEKNISDELGLLALQMGAKEVRETEKQAPAEIQITIEEEVPVVEESVSHEVDPKLIECLEQLIEEGDPANFKADGGPKSQVVNKLMSRTVVSDERDAAWEQVLNS